ncbi:MAG: bifunctional oligoribonuclease/PAP phosphatase NrnA [Phycisphaerae bacterium]|jgi:bifunctional oligoribonuclease and PAP phosphatase NrnA|nr:bifunctional oligoribonuclease/PAP phosphatase NrnA [Phycisphaerae bacterium]
MTSQTGVYESTASYTLLAERITNSNRIVITTHRKPDGDAIGSVVGLARGLASIGKEVESLFIGPIEHGLQLAIGDTEYRLLEEHGEPTVEPDLIIVADTGAWSQLEALEPWLRKRKDKVIGLDHHANGDEVAGDRVVDVSAAACTQVVMALFEEMGIGLGSGRNSIAEALFIGLGTDTGWFRFSNADARCFADASRLLEQGIDRYQLYRLLEETARPARIELLQRMLASVEYVGPVAVMELRSADFQETNGSSTDIIGLVNTPLVLENIQAAILLTDSDPSVTKISFRSKPALPSNPDSLINVNELASNFEGGGHIHAAGARVFLPLEDVKARLVDLIQS